MLELLKKLAAHNVQVAVEDGHLSISLADEDSVLPDELIHEIREHKSALIQYINTYASRDHYAPIPQVQNLDSYAVSDNQWRLWLLCQREETCRAFNLPRRIDLSGSFSPLYFEQAIRKVIARHEILRTVFRENAAGDLKQWIIPAPQYSFALQYVDFEGRPPHEAEAFIQAESTRLFDLANGPLLSAALLHMDADRFVFYYNIHHIVSDGWSQELLEKEVLAYYNACAAKSGWEAPPLRIQYKDYAAWQQQELASEGFSPHRTYWLQQLAGELPVLALPADKPRPPVFTYNGHAFSMTIAKEPTARLVALCKKNNGTLFMGLLAILNALFYRYTAQKDIIIGSPVAGRNHAELEDQMGVYYNMLALRTQFNDNDSFEELFRKVREVTLAAYEHQLYPFDHLVEELGLKRDMSRSALFDVMMALENQVTRSTDDTAQTGKIADNGPVTAHYDMTFDFVELGKSLHMDLRFNTDIYAPESVIRLMHHFRRFLEAVVAGPALPLWQIDYLMEEERELLLNRFGGTKAVIPTHKSLVQLLAEQAARTPDNVAVAFGTQQLTYRELDIRSNRLAHYLRSLGVGKGWLVPLCISRSLDMMTAIWGILKTGGAYVPLDPAYPRERILRMLEDSAASVIVTDTLCRELVLSDTDACLVLLDCDWNCIAALPEQPVPDGPAPEDLDYVIYTSGSTGRPKGVMIEHASLVNMLFAMISVLEATELSSILAITTYSFDMAYLELYMVLLTGGKIILLSREYATDGYLLIEAIEQYRPSFIQATPSSWQMLADCGLTTTYGATVLTGGEALNEPLKKQLLQMSNGQVWNLYGPTEAAVWATAARLQPDKKISVGKPIYNVNAYVLDDHQQLLPVGATGEIYIGGIQLARGYWKQKELTREKFIPDPFKKGERIYRTGDMAKWWPDGSIEYLGRIDHQVKIHGHRIELGDIEQALLELDGIDAAVVTAGSREDGVKYLTGYFISAQTQLLSSIREGLLQRLPEYMVPPYFVQLDSFPVTPNGKIDRKALPSPETAGMSSEAAYVAPRNDTEAMLAALWEQLFRRKEISAKGHFFELGGDSIKAVLLTGWLKQRGHKVAAGDILNYPLLEDLAAQLDNVTGNDSLLLAAADPDAGKPSPDGLYELSANQQLYCRENGSKQAAGVIEYYLDNFDKTVFLQAYRQLVSLVDMLRIRFHDNNGKLLKEILPPGSDRNTLLLRETSRLDLLSPDNTTLRKDWIDRPFDLFGGEVMRCGVLHTEKEAYMIMVIHHAVTDHVSNQLLRDIFDDCYQGRQVTPPPPYLDFVAAQQQFLQSAAAGEQLQYWQQRLEPVIPAEKNRHITTETAVIINRNAITGQAFEQLQQYCKREGLLTGSFLLSAFSLFLLAEYPEQRYLLADYVVNGRDMALPGFTAGNVIGQFTNYLPLTFSCSRDTATTDTIKKIQQVYLEGRARQELPYEVIRQDFRRRKQTDLYGLADIVMNDVAVPDHPFPGAYTVGSEKNTDPAILADQGFGRMFAKCHTYSNGISLEWGIRCPEQDCNALIADRYYPRLMQYTLQQMLDFKKFKLQE